MEDNLKMEAGVSATNEKLVERTVSIVEKLGCEPATAAEARELMGFLPAGPPREHDPRRPSGGRRCSTTSAGSLAAATRSRT